MFAAVGAMGSHVRPTTIPAKESSMAITVGIIGCGNIARFHLAGLTAAGARVAWVCDLNSAAAAAWATTTGARATSDHRQVLADPAVDAVVITTVSPAHPALCLDAIAAGKAVICEKTLAVNPADALAIVRAAEAAGTVFFTSYMKRFIPAVERAKQLLPSLGRIIATNVRAWQPWGDLWTAMPASGWAHTPPDGVSGVVRGSGGGVLMCGGSHLADLVLHLIGRPTRAFASMTVLPGRDYDLQATALLETANGPVTLSAIAHPLSRIGFLGDGWDERIEILGTRGRIEVLSALWDDPEHKTSLLIHDDEATGTRTEHRFAPQSPFVRAQAAYLADIAARSQRVQTRWTGYEADELLAAITRSARSGAAVDLAWQSPTPA